MQISTFRDELVGACLSFAWDQWAQMGVLAGAHRQDTWAMDPEALVVFSLEISRNDPRLFDEILDWMLINERLVSVQRLRNLSVGRPARALVDAALSWVATTKGRRSSLPGSQVPDSDSELSPLFPGLTTPRTELDHSFREQGFAKPPTVPSRKSRPPDVDAPVNLAFRLRYLLGVGVRAEVMRCLLTIDAPRVSTQVIARSAAYSKRNVQEALNSLRAARALSAITVGGDQGYRVERERWSPLLRFDEDNWPTHRDWPQLLGAIARIVRWTDENGMDEATDYMRASRVRDLLEEIAEDLLFAGVQVERLPPGGGEDVSRSLVMTARHAVRALGLDLAGERLTTPTP
jgi:hypothetical protein